MDNNSIIACICEGSAEQAIIELLLENDKLIFKKQQLIDEKVIRIRSSASFEEKYLRKQFDKRIKIIRILDSRHENFKLSKLYKDKVEVINVVTAPEIEMLIIHNEDKFDDYKKSKLKPSDYCKQKLKHKNVKSYKFVKDYFSSINTLISAIELYKNKSNVSKSEKTLFDLLSK